jgi:hypothetical protein
MMNTAERNPRRGPRLAGWKVSEGCSQCEAYQTLMPEAAVPGATPVYIACVVHQIGCPVAAAAG